MAAAVSEAGVLAQCPLWLAEIDVLRTRIRDITSLASNPFAINLRTYLGEGVRIISLFWGDPSDLA